MVVFMADGAREKVVRFQAELVAVAVESLHLHHARAFHGAVFALDREATLVPDLPALCLYDHGIDKFKISLRDVHDKRAAEHADLHGGKPRAVGVLERFLHVVEQLV